MKGGKTISRGKSGYSGGRALSYSHLTTHAEVQALHRAKLYKRKKHEKLTLVSLAFDGRDFLMSKPCYNCCRTAMDCGVDKIAWFENGFMQYGTPKDVMESAIFSSGDRAVHQGKVI
tara:strand:+ start:442 stop:792 length:351 start_codon:yes stop_codon:yes gene_type:complete